MIVGSAGMAGHVISRYLKEQGHEVFNVSSLNHKTEDTNLQLDVADESNRKMLIKSIADFKPDVVINAVGMLVKACEQRPDMAVLINSFFPHFLANVSKQFSFKLIHLSTDCVFSGKRRIGFYTEDDTKDETNMYGRSKAMGEVTYDNHLTIRTSIIGPELKKDGIGLLNWFLNQNDTVNGFTKHYWNGITTYELAQFINYAIQQNICGLVQIHSSMPVSKYSMLMSFHRAYNKNINIIPHETEIVNKTIKRTRTDFVYNEKTVDEMVDELVKWYG